MSKAGRKANRLADTQAKAATWKSGDEVKGNVVQQAQAMGVELVRPVQDRSSQNKFLGSDKLKSKINPNGFDAVERAKKLAKQQVKAKLAKAVSDHG